MKAGSLPYDLNSVGNKNVKLTNNVSYKVVDAKIIFAFSFS